MHGSQLHFESRAALAFSGQYKLGRTLCSIFSPHKYVHMKNSILLRTADNCCVRLSVRTRAEDEGHVLVPETEKVVKLLALATLSLQIGSNEAIASEWYPRRHHRKLQSQSTLDKLMLKNERRRRRKQEQEKKIRLQQETEELQKAIQQVKNKDDVLVQSLESIKNMLGQQRGSVKPSYSVGVTSRPPPSAYYGHSIRQRETPLPIGMSIVWGIIGISVFWYFKNKFGWKLPGGRAEVGGAKGRWVRDRSLGGKMVFIEDSTASKKSPRPLWDDLPGEEEIKRTKTVPGYISDLEEPDLQSAVKKSSTPVWWAPPEAVKYVSKDRKIQLQKQADSIVRQLQNQKIELGQDYALRGLVDLRMTCNNGGGLTVTTSTQSGRDSMLRMALRHSLENPKSSLGGYEPSRFVSGIAADLNVPQDRAITIVHAEIASICRNALIDAEAAFRSQDDRLLSASLLKVIYVLQSFPIPSGSPEMEMVGRSIMRTTSLEFRKSVFFTAGAADVSIAPIVAEIVGFDPELVMPQLILQMQSTPREDIQSE